MGLEYNYLAIENLCLALIFVVKKLRHYILAYEVRLIACADLIKFVRNCLILMGQIGKWAVILMEFDINYVP